MIDHLKRYDSEEDAIDDPLVSMYRTDDGWDTSRVLPGCRVYTSNGTIEDDDGNIIEDREYLPYWYLWIAETEVKEDLLGECIVIANRETKEIIDSLIPEEDLPLYKIEPVLAGSDYPFGALV